ncbi:c-type cytochrome [Frateuria defendens]|uniref:c-type cytochrome n=1 Tax=Frateuria defendens TaxID=2219559 RepID=UPI00066FE408|nr:cytochrome c [Frateuria defendens]
MRPAIRPSARIGRSLRALAGLALCAGLLPAAARADAPAADAALIERGAYLARAADCAACHTDPKGGAPFAGGYAIASPLGDIVASNITPSKTAGIGHWSEQQFARAVREGIDAEGHHLYPAMPYTAYAGITDEDMHALYAYFTQGVQPVDTVPPATRLPFPFNLRASMAVWNALYLKNQRFQPDAAAGADLNRGRYLVDVLGHCSACHSPRTALMAEDGSRYLAGGEVGGWLAPNLTSDPVSGIGGWSNEELVAYLKTGHVAGKAQAAGPMAEAIGHSLRHLSDADLGAIAAYLKTVKPLRDGADRQPAYALAGSATPTPLTVSEPLPAKDSNSDPNALADTRSTDGALLYNGACASCHQLGGQGTADRFYPSLNHNTAVGASRPNNLVMAILEGVHREGADGEVLMPGFAHDLDDTQVAAVATYVSRQFGDPKATVTAAQVATLRHGGPAPRLLTLMPWLIGLAAIVVLAVLALVLRGLRRKRRR